MTTSKKPTTTDESWADALQHMAQLHAAMIVAPAGSCAGIKQQMNELERSLGITYETALEKGLIQRTDPGR